MDVAKAAAEMRDCFLTPAAMRVSPDFKFWLAKKNKLIT